MRGGDERDSQRKRLYDAEDAVPVGRRFSAVADCERYLDWVLSHRWFRRHFPAVTGYVVHDGRRRQSAAGWSRFGRVEMALPRWARSERVILHELAHGVIDAGGIPGIRTYQGIAAHGWQFARVFLMLYRHYMGAEAGDIMRRAFRNHRVRYAAPRKGRPMTPEQRAAAIERLAASRRRRDDEGRNR